MTAEDKLKELYEKGVKEKEMEEEASKEILPFGRIRLGMGTYPKIDSLGGIYMAAEDIDLIANLVVERLKNAGV